ncbi:hypothetical protein VTN77DRAFT_9237 [Rasamsonia byssochlamydoides]|uniref:uncharacterized protein n=1 Tax=Rasamsonia byssochlamydoides TaxID=89139 RepID=UPI003744A5A1
MATTTEEIAEGILQEKPASSSGAHESAAAASPAASQQSQPQLTLTDQTQRLSFSRLIVTYISLATCFFVSFMDVNAATTALPAISRSLNASNTITWVGTSYLLAQCAFQVIYGRLADIFGRKPVLIGCVASLIVGDLLCGFARTGPWLYVCRAISGVGGGGISSLVQITVSDLVSLKERGKYQGLLSGAIGLGAATGPFISAALIETGEKGWRWAFWVPAILASLCVPTLMLLVPQKPVTGSWQEKVKRIDWMGLFSAITGILFILISVNSGGSVWPWDSALVISLLAIGSVFFIGFLVIEWKVARLQMLPLRLFASLSRSTLFVQNFLFGFVWQADLYFLPTYYQDVRGYSPMRSALLSLPLLLMQSIGGVCSGPMMSFLTRYLPALWLGFILWTIGAGLKTLFSRTSPIALYVVAVMVEGLGVGFVFQPALVALQALSNRPDMAVTTSARNWMRALGSAVGVAVSTAVQYGVMKASLPADLPASIRTQVLDGSWKVGQGQGVWDATIIDAKMKGMHAVFVMFVPLMGACLLGCLLIRDERLLGDNEKKEDFSLEGAEEKKRGFRRCRLSLR